MVNLSPVQNQQSTSCLLSSQFAFGAKEEEKSKDASISSIMKKPPQQTLTSKVNIIKRNIQSASTKPGEKPRSASK
jgi:hypothetical protein